MKHICSQCGKKSAIGKRIKVVADMDAHSFCSAECRDNWLCLNGAGSEAVEVAKGVFILCPSV